MKLNLVVRSIALIKICSLYDPTDAYMCGLIFIDILPIVWAYSYIHTQQYTLQMIMSNFFFN